MPRPKNGNKNTHVCVGGVREHVCSPLGAGRGRGHQAETPPAWAPPSAPCPQPWWGALFPGDPKLEMPHETPCCSPLAFCSRTCPQERSEKRFFSCRHFPISVQGGPHNYGGSGTVSNSQRPVAAERVCRRPCSRQHYLRMSSSAGAALLGQRISGCLPGLSTPSSRLQTRRSLGRKE